MNVLEAIRCLKRYIRPRGVHPPAQPAAGDSSPLDKQKGVRGVQYLSIRSIERLGEAGIAPSVKRRANLTPAGVRPWAWTVWVDVN